MRTDFLWRIASWLVAVVIGAFFGVAGTIAHGVTWQGVPVGLIVASITCAALLTAIRALTHDRLVTLAAGTGMLGMLLLFSGPGPGGSVVLRDGDLAHWWVWIVAILIAAAVLWPARRGRASYGETEQHDL